MCLHLKLKKRFCVSYDIMVYKVLNDHNTHNIVTPYQNTPVNFDNDGMAELSIDSERLKPNMWDCVHYGIHSYYDMLACFNMADMFRYKDYLAVIPAGTPFYVGDCLDIVSSKLLIFESLKDLDSYEEKHGKTTPLRKILQYAQL